MGGKELVGVASCDSQSMCDLKVWILPEHNNQLTYIEISIAQFGRNYKGDGKGTSNWWAMQNFQNSQPSKLKCIKMTHEVRYQQGLFFVTSDLIDGCKGRNCTTAYWSTSGEAAHSQRLEVKWRRNPLRLENHKLPDHSLTEYHDTDPTSYQNT